MNEYSKINTTIVGMINEEISNAKGICDLSK